MPLSPHVRQRLLKRLSAIESQKIVLTGPDLRCATVEDAERLVVRFTAWLEGFSDLSATCDLEEDRLVLAELHATFHGLVADLKVAIRATRDQGIPWEDTKDFTAGTIAARSISGTGFIDPNIAVTGDRIEEN